MATTVTFEKKQAIDAKIINAVHTLQGETNQNAYSYVQDEYGNNLPADDKKDTLIMEPISEDDFDEDDALIEGANYTKVDMVSSSIKVGYIHPKPGAIEPTYCQVGRDELGHTTFGEELNITKYWTSDEVQKYFTTLSSNDYKGEAGTNINDGDAAAEITMYDGVTTLIPSPGNVVLSDGIEYLCTTENKWKRLQPMASIDGVNLSGKIDSYKNLFLVKSSLPDFDEEHITDTGVKRIGNIIVGTADASAMIDYLSDGDLYFQVVDEE